MSTGDQEVIDFSHGLPEGWSLDDYPSATVIVEEGNHFLRSDNPRYYNGMVLRKAIPGLEVGGY